MKSNGDKVGFGKHFVVLNLDLMSILIDAAKSTPKGQTFVSNCVKWNDAVHQVDVRPLTIFTTLSFSTQNRPELVQPSAFSRLLEGFGDFDKGSNAVQIHQNFQTDEKDIILQKTRWYAGEGNPLEQILRSQNIDTVVLVSLTRCNRMISRLIMYSPVGPKFLGRCAEHCVPPV